MRVQGKPRIFCCTIKQRGVRRIKGTCQKDTEASMNRLPVAKSEKIWTSTWMIITQGIKQELQIHTDLNGWMNKWKVNEK